MIELLAILALVGLLAWVLVQLVPMPDAVRTVIIAVAVIACILIVVRAFGIDVPVPQLR